jgi:hypothetical protein
VELFEYLDAVERDAAGALDRARQPYLYDSLEWLKLTRTHVLTEAGFVAARARDEQGRSAWLMLQDQGGRRAAAFAGWYTLAFAPIFSCSPHQQPQGAGERSSRPPLLAAIARALRSRFDAITFSPVDDERGFVSLLKQAFSTSGWLARQSVATANWIAETDGHPFSDYWSERPSRLRNTVERKRKRAQLDIRILDRFNEQSWSAYEAVYQASWKPAEGSPAFLRAFAEQSSRWGSLRLGLAFDQGRPVAAQLWTVDGDIATIHKLAHDEGAKANSPGTVLSAAMFEHVIDRDRPMIVDFGTGDDAYKADWMDQKRPLYRLDLYNMRAPGGIAAAGQAGARALVRRLRND